MTTNSIIGHADCHDALLIARTSIRALIAIILLTLIGQIALFFTYRYRIVNNGMTPVVSAPSAMIAPSTQPITPTLQPTEQLIAYGVGLTQFFALGAALSLSATLFVTLNIMIIARVVGIAPVARAMFASLPLVVLLFPWQAFLNNQHLTAVDFKIPGVLYSWGELRNTAHWTDAAMSMPGYLHWARFVVFPCATLLLVIALHGWTMRGIRSALSGAAAGE